MGPRYLGRLIGNNSTNERRLWINFQKEKCKRKLKSLAGLFGYKFVVKIHFKDAKEVAQQNVTFFFQVLYTKVKHMSRYDVTVHLRYDVTGLELTVWLETLRWLAVTNAG